MKILLVEDKLSDAELLIAILGTVKELTPEIVCAPDLAFALQCLARDSFDMVLLDIVLPDCAGTEGIIALRKHFDDVPVVMLTGINDMQLALECLKNGAQDYLLRGEPSADSIYRALRYAMERKRADIATSRLKVWEEREQFMAMLVHDLRSPLTGCTRLVSMLLGGCAGTLSEEQNQLLSMVANSNKSMLTMITNLLETYRMESGGAAIVLADLSLNSVVEDCVANMLPAAVEKKISLRTHISNPTFAHADAMAMRSVVANLIGNAVKFTNKGGCIDIELRSHGDTVILSVKDSGVGIEPSQFEHLYKRFFQADSRSRSAGLGLGLYLCKLFVDAQCGKVECQSTPGVGTEFTVTLPAAKVEVETEPVAKETSFARAAVAGRA